MKHCVTNYLHLVGLSVQGGADKYCILAIVKAAQTVVQLGLRWLSLAIPDGQTGSYLSCKHS